MNPQKLPFVPILRNTLQKKQITPRQQSHRKTVNQFGYKKIQEILNPQSESYRTLLENNPKRNYMLETKYTEIQRQNRLLFEKISRIGGKKSKRSQVQSNRSLNMNYRKKRIQQIQIDNAKMYNRISNQKPSISFREVNKNFEKTRRISNRMSQFKKRQVQDWY